MSTMEYRLSDYWLPLKNPLPEFHYDLATWCEYLLAIGTRFPPYLKDLEEQVRSYAIQKDSVQPGSFRNGCRIYVFDHRLGVQLVLLDEAGATAQWCHDFVRGNFRLDQYVYGDGELIGPQLPDERWDDAFLERFINSFGFTPMEELGVSWLLIFMGSKLDERRPVAPWQVAFMLMKYRNKTLINWSEKLKDRRYK